MSKERLENIKEYLSDNICPVTRGPYYTELEMPIDTIEWLIEQAKCVEKLEKDNMRKVRALRHIANFPMHFCHERHSKRALKIARKELKRNE